LIELQNRVVDFRFREGEYRSHQNYVGESIAWERERIHYVPPKHADLPELMGGLEALDQRVGDGGVSPVVHAALVGYGFVFLHPFEDGNGRIHRFLIHNVLAMRGYTPRGVMFPVSATMLNQQGDYDQSLEAFSSPLMALIDYHLDRDGRMTVDGDTAPYYRYVDMTAQAEALFALIESTIEVELTGELDFLANYDQSKSAIQSVVDMPDRLIDLFIRFCLQNNGRLSMRKRTQYFSFLEDEELVDLEKAVKAAYRISEA